MSVPVPVLVNPPVPEIAPCRVSVLPLVSKVPPGVVSVIGRAMVKLAVAWIVPPTTVSIVPAAPKALSEPACTMPPLIVVPPV